MAEQTRSRSSETRPGPSGLDDPFESGGAVHVRRAFQHEWLPVGGMTVGEIRRRFQDRFDIHADARASLNGDNVTDESVVVRAGDRLEFAPRAGEKGRSAGQREWWGDRRMGGA